MPVIFISEILAADRLVTIDAARVIGYHVKERRPPDVVPPYKLKIDAHALTLSANAASVTKYSGAGGSTSSGRRNRSVTRLCFGFLSIMSVSVL